MSGDRLEIGDIVRHRATGARGVLRSVYRAPDPAVWVGDVYLVELDQEQTWPLSNITSAGGEVERPAEAVPPRAPCSCGDAPIEVGDRVRWEGEGRVTAIRTCPFSAAKVTPVYCLGSVSISPLERRPSAPASSPSIDVEDAEVTTRVDATYPCDKCGKLRTKAEGGTTFTICDACWDEKYGATGGGS